MNNEIKKALYKEKPVAKVIFGEVYNGELYHYYEAETSIGTATFKIPNSDMGDKIFNSNEPAQLLIRWLVTEDKEVYGG